MDRERERERERDHISMYENKKEIQFVPIYSVIPFAYNAYNLST